MGIELDRFTNPIDDELKCTICCGVLESAVQINECEHTFCSQCIEEWVKIQSICPIDRRLITSDDIKPASRLLNSFLSRLHVKCDFHESGCNSIITLESLASHLIQCNFNPEKAIPCVKGCGVLLTAKQKNDHNCVLEDILIAIENINTKVRKFEKVLENDNKRIEVLEKKCDIIDELTDKLSRLESKYENLALKLSQISDTSMRNTSFNDNNRNRSTSDVFDTPLQHSSRNAHIYAEIPDSVTVFKTMNIEIDHKLKIIELSVNINEPIMNIKRKISDKEIMPIEYMCLFHRDQVLSDNKSLKDYEITANYLTLMKRPIRVDVIIFSENITFTVEPFDTIINIKEKILKKRGFNVTLSYFGQNLEDNKNLFSYKIRDRAKLKVTAISTNKDRGKSLPKINF